MPKNELKLTTIIGSKMNDVKIRSTSLSTSSKKKIPMAVEMAWNKMYSNSALHVKVYFEFLNERYHKM